MRQSLGERVRVCENWYKQGGGKAATHSHRSICQIATTFKKRGIRKILDIGCGRGKLFEALGWQNFRMAGTEIVPHLITTDLRLMPVYPYSIENLKQIEDNEYDLCIFCDVLDCLRDIEEVNKALSEASRIATQGVLITLGRATDLRVLHWERETWERVIKEKVPGIRDVTEDDNSVLRIAVWKNGAVL